MAAPGERTVSRSEYRSYMQSAAWRATKRRYWKSDRPKYCYVCERRNIGPLQLHHRTYKNLGNERLIDLVPVHDECHQLIHRIDDARTDRRGGLWASTGMARDEWRRTHGKKPKANRKRNPLSKPKLPKARKPKAKRRR